MNTEISETAAMLTQAEDVIVNAKAAGKKANAKKAAKKNVKLATVEQVVATILPEELEDSCMTEPSDLEIEVELEDWEEPDGELSEVEEESFDGAVNRALQSAKAEQLEHQKKFTAKPVKPTK